MSTGTEHQPAVPDPTETAALVRQIADAPDAVALRALLAEGLTRLFPLTRLDLFASEGGGERLVLTCGSSDEAPPPGWALSAFVAWLARQGYAASATLPLSVAGRPQGCLSLARRQGSFSPGTLAVAGEIAAALALRLAHDRLVESLAVRETQLQIGERRLAEVEEIRLRATLAAGAAHDAGNLFASVLGYAQLLQQQAPPALQGDIRTIVQAARDGHHLLRRMVGKSGSAEVGDAPLTVLPALVHDALRLTQPFWEARPSITVKIALAPVPPVRAHPAELREVLVNLILNSVAAMPDGGVLTVRTYAAGERALVEVSDTGIGIALGNQGEIFQPLVTTRETGSGLGLTVSRALIESYGGTIAVASDPGRGSTFTVSLPSARGGESHAGPPALRYAAP